MKQILISILIGFLFISCEDVINSDDNVFKSPIQEVDTLALDSMDYDLFYAIISDDYRIMKYDILNDEKTIWKNAALFLNKSINDNLLYIDNNQISKNFVYNIYDFINLQNHELFNGESVQKYYRLINNNKLIESASFKYNTGSPLLFISTDLNNSTKRPAFGLALNNIHPSYDGFHYAVYSLYYAKPILYNSSLQSSNFNLSDNIYPYEWINDEEIICFNYNSLMNETSNNFLIKYNIKTNQIDTIITSENIDLCFPKLSPDRKKIAFTILPDGVGITNIDGSNLELLRNSSNSIVSDLKSFNEWSPDGRYLLNRRFFGNSSGIFYYSGLEVINTQTGEIKNIEKDNSVIGATWIKYKN